jgi:hypothetical protein
MASLKLKLSPNVRLRMTLKREMALDPDRKVFNDGLRQKYIVMHQAAISKQEGLIRSFILVDIALAVVAFGKDFSIPGVGFDLQDIPAALHVLIAASSLVSLFLCISFQNALLYAAVVDVFNDREASPLLLDPDWIGAGDIFNELFLKTSRAKMDHRGGDFYRSGGAFKLYYGVLSFFLSLSVFSVAILHYYLIGYGLWQVGLEGWFSVLFCLSAIVMGLASIMVFISPSFNFEVVDTAAEAESFQKHQ